MVTCRCVLFVLLLLDVRTVVDLVLFRGSWPCPMVTVSFGLWAWRMVRTVGRFALLFPLDFLRRSALLSVLP